MIEDAMQAATDVARAQMPTGVVAAWALAGVIAAGVLFATMRRPDFDARIGGSLLIVGAVAGALLWSATRPPVRYFKQVDEVLAERDAIRSRRHDLQVHGFVVPGSLEQRLGKDEFRFRLETGPDRPHAVIEARYTGLLPDAVLHATQLAQLLSRRVQVIVRGTLAADGRLDVIPDGFIVKRPVD